MDTFINLIKDIWTAEFAVTGQGIALFFLLNLICMMSGRFRWSFITSIGATFYLLFFMNRALLARHFNDIGMVGMFVLGGAFFLVLMIWSFFIDSD